MRLEGVILPVTTPFDSVSGDIAPISFRENLRAWLEAGVHGFVIAGSTGEGPLLEDEEIVQLVSWARDVVPPERVLIAGTGRESTRATIGLSRSVAEQGADAVLVRPPGYYRRAMDAERIRRHFEQVANAIGVPVIIYHVPQFVPVDVTPGTLGELAAHSNITGIKDSTGDLKSLSAFLDAAPEGFAVLVGAGSQLYAAMELGAAGGIVAIGNVAPAQAAEVFNAFRGGDTGAAGRAQSVLTGPHDAIVRGVGVAGIKYALDTLGYHGGDPRPPLRPLDEATRGEVRQVLAGAGLI